MSPATRRGTIAVGVVAYIVLFHWAYIAIISPIYAYDGFVDNPMSFKDLVLAAALALLPAAWMPIAVRRPSQVVYWLLYLLVIIPAAVVPLRANAVDPPEFLIFFASIVGAFALLGRIYSVPLLRLAIPRFAPRTFWVVISIVTLSSFALLLTVTEAPLRFVALQDVYVVRSSFKEILAREGTMFAYIVMWQTYVLYPLFMTIGLVRKQIVLLIIGVAGEAFIYSVTGFKSALFSGLLFFILLAALRKQGRNFGLSAIWGMVGALVLMLTASASMNRYVVAIFLQRTLALPAMLTAYYFDFFSHNPKTLLGHSILKPFVDYPYDVDISYLIGRAYFRSVQTSANANIWADAFGNFGYSGIIGFTLILAVVLWLFDSAAEHMDYRIVALMLGIPAFSLANSGLLTCLLTHGVGLALVVVFIIPRDDRVAPQTQQS